MNAIPPKPLSPDPQRSRPAEADGVRLTIDFDEELPPDIAEAGPALRERGPAETTGGDTAGPEAVAGPEPRRAKGRSGAVPAHLAAIEVTLSVEIGCHQIPLRDLLGVEPGQLVPLDRMTAEPVSVLVNGRPFARGEVVAIGERYGVRLLEILDAAGG
jgi:flagellar motor switch protein FliN/FliY